MSESRGAVPEGDEEQVHRYEPAGLEEGNRPVPRWYLLVALGLLVFAIVYVASYLTGVQPSAADFR